MNACGYEPYFTIADGEDIMPLYAEKYAEYEMGEKRTSSPPSRVFAAPGYVELHTGTYAYHIEWSQIKPGDANADILWWAHHLCGKTWSDTTLVYDFIEAARDHYEGN